MIEHMRHTTATDQVVSRFEAYDKKINELIRVMNETTLTVNKLYSASLTPAKKKKLEKINLLKKQLKQLEMEL